MNLRMSALLLTTLCFVPACKSRPRRAEPAAPEPRIVSTIKPIEPNVGEPAPQLGDRFLDGALVVEEVRRHKQDSFLSAQVRLKNSTGEVVSFEARIAFFDGRGKPIADAIVGWRSAFADPYGVADLTQTCPIPGATDWRLEVRTPTGDVASDSVKAGATEAGGKPAVEPAPQ